MTTEQKQVRDWMSAFGQETPEKPTIPSFEVRKLRAKLILEEALETIRALGITASDQDESGEWYSIHDIDWSFNNVDRWKPNLTEIADGCEDLKVVTEGTLVACGLCPESKLYFDDCGHTCYEDKDPLFDEVMRSNWSKLWRYSELATAEKDGYKVKLLSNIEQEITVVKSKIGNICHASIRPSNPDPRIYLVKDSTGKVIKSPSYSAANLEPIIEAMES